MIDFASQSFPPKSRVVVYTPHSPLMISPAFSSVSSVSSPAVSDSPSSTSSHKPHIIMLELGASSWDYSWK